MDSKAEMGSALMLVILRWVLLPATLKGSPPISLNFGIEFLSHKISSKRLSKTLNSKKRRKPTTKVLFLTKKKQVENSNLNIALLKEFDEIDSLNSKIFKDVSEAIKELDRELQFDKASSNSVRPFLI